jgi:hypothetical protein
LVIVIISLKLLKEKGILFNLDFLTKMSFYTQIILTMNLLFLMVSNVLVHRLVLIILLLKALNRKLSHWMLLRMLSWRCLTFKSLINFYDNVFVIWLITSQELHLFTCCRTSLDPLTIWKERSSNKWLTQMLIT